jgi:threonine synthase
MIMTTQNRPPRALEGAPAADAPANITDLVGNTPLVRLRHVSRGLPPGVEVLAKAEFFNPGGSVKDRAALSMIRDGERRGLLRPGKTIIDASSGNTGIAYAWIGGRSATRSGSASPKRVARAQKDAEGVRGRGDADVADGGDRRRAAACQGDRGRRSRTVFLSGPVQQ